MASLWGVYRAAYGTDPPEEFDWPFDDLPDFVNDDLLRSAAADNFSFNFINPANTSILCPCGVDPSGWIPCACALEKQYGHALFPGLPSPTKTLDHEAGAAPQRQEMEIGTAAGITAAPPSFPANPYTNPDTIVNDPVTNAVLDMGESDMPFSVSPQSLYETPDTSRFLNHLQPSNVRENVEAQLNVSGPDSAGRDAANSLANMPFGLSNADYSTTDGNAFSSANNNVATHQQPNSDLYSNVLLDNTTALDILPQETQAYAKLAFADGDFFITTPEVRLGRNMSVYDQYVRKNKQQREARYDLASYRQEPSQPSQHEDADLQRNPSSSSQSLEGRPPPPNNVSELGGAVSYPVHTNDETDMHRTPRKKRRSNPISNPSSNTSVNPVMIQSSMSSDKNTKFGPDGEPENQDSAWVPIHPQQPEDITRISKHHLTFFFDPVEGCWRLNIVGNRAWVNEHLHDKGTILKLEHNDEIQIATVLIHFKLPDNVRGSPGMSQGTFSKSDDDLTEDDDVEPSTSPVERLSRAMEGGDMDGDEVDTKERATQPKSKPKANIKKEDLKRKKQKKETANEVTTEAVKKGKKPKAGGKTSPEAKEEQPPTPPRIEPGSGLESIPINQLPQKRKGPGRPPKNGVISKRDKALAEKMGRELEKKGQYVPDFNIRVDIVRREQKIKDARQKAIQNGEPPDGTTVVPSVEIAPEYSAAKTSSGPKATMSGQTDTSTQPARKAASPNTQKRADKSTSPIPPMASYTEDQLKKPPLTYVNLLDEVLREHPHGQGDLPDLYKRIKKKYPYFAYMVSTKGWESSVRHNLLGTSRFMAMGKSGKGQVWAINPEVPLEREHKKKKSPPVHRPTANMQQPGQYGQAQYGNQFGNSQPNGQEQGANPSGSGYYSPYAQTGQKAQFGPQHAQGRSSNLNGQPANSGPPAGPPSQWDLMIGEFIKLSHKYKATYQDQPNEVMVRKDSLWTISLNALSEAFHSGDPAAVVLDPPQDEEDAKMLTELKELFTGTRLKEAAGIFKQPNQGMQPSMNQAVENGAASAAVLSQPSGAFVANQPTAGISQPAAQMSASFPSQTVQVRPNPNINSSRVTGGTVMPPANFVPPTTSQQLFSGGAGTKRSAEDDGAGPDSKKSKGE